ncbi:MAG: D-glycero-beta-D-manno-heptose 1-phosphate adenylyltransferase [Candidatus Omnitrophota bacterium]|nr:MAG: D-glycero-beta-D-manno-heptose 1-phosphate adenylyltransferase [Candidatus Omnitrophota bacterium]HDN98070.1 D-glycero-beta-D-manno-heptose 1-phosphate adenylyltransferase [bacterium]
MQMKIKNLSELKNIISKLKKEGKKIVFTNGCFDILHIGHIRCLKEAKKHGDILVVGLNSDSSVRRLKGENRPYIEEKERAEIISSLEMVDYVIIFDEDTPLKIIKELKPDVIVKGGDYKEKDVVGGDFVKRYGGKVVIAPLVKGRSTSLLVEKIKKNG